MKLFADTGNLKEIQALAELGILDGVTTNPSLLAKESGDYRAILKQICTDGEGPGQRRSGGHRRARHDSRRAATWPASTSTSSSRCRSPRTA